MSNNWKQKYINKFIAVSPAYDGCPESLQTVLSGNNMSLNQDLFGSCSDYCNTQRTMAGIISMIPLHKEMYGKLDKNGLGNGNTVIVYPLEKQHSNLISPLLKTNIQQNVHHDFTVYTTIKTVFPIF